MTTADDYMQSVIDYVPRGLALRDSDRDGS